MEDNGRRSAKITTTHFSPRDLSWASLPVISPFLWKETRSIRKNVFRPCLASWVVTLLLSLLGHGRAGGCWSGKSHWHLQLQPRADWKTLEQARTKTQACKQPGKLISDPTYTSFIDYEDLIHWMGIRKRRTVKRRHLSLIPLCMYFWVQRNWQAHHLSHLDEVLYTKTDEFPHETFFLEW